MCTLMEPSKRNSNESMTTRYNNFQTLEVQWFHLECIIMEIHGNPLFEVGVEAIVVSGSMDAEFIPGEHGASQGVPRPLFDPFWRVRHPAVFEMSRASYGLGLKAIQVVKFDCQGSGHDHRPAESADVCDDGEFRADIHDHWTAKLIQPRGRKKQGQDRYVAFWSFWLVFRMPGKRNNDSPSGSNNRGLRTSLSWAA